MIKKNKIIVAKYRRISRNNYITDRFANVEILFAINVSNYNDVTSEVKIFQCDSTGSTWFIFNVTLKTSIKKKIDKN